tara:strand:+ start:103 stop:249 length:147 start_codon:yes stop_codon:yes gene_type:complete
LVVVGLAVLSLMLQVVMELALPHQIYNPVQEVVVVELMLDRLVSKMLN